jgi:hypothetical protein
VVIDEELTYWSLYWAWFRSVGSAVLLSCVFGLVSLIKVLIGVRGKIASIHKGILMSHKLVFHTRAAIGHKGIELLHMC